MIEAERPTLREIVRRTCKEREVKTSLIRGPLHYRELVWIRALIVARARAHGYSYPEIGRELCRHHTTIMNLDGKLYGKRRAVNEAADKAIPESAQ